MDIYYRIDGNTCYYCNEAKAGYTRRLGHDYEQNIERYIVTELTNGKFTLPEDSAFLFAKSNNVTFDTSNGDTSNCTDMTALFFDNPKMKYIELSSFNTSNVTSMSSMFSLCRNLEGAEVEYFNRNGSSTSKVESFSYMFFNCQTLFEIGVGTFNTSSCTDMEAMFCGCESLEQIYVKSFDVSKVTKFDRMFSSCESATKIIADDNTDGSLIAPAGATSSDMFDNTPSLPRPNVIHTDLSYANNTKPNGKFYPYKNWFSPQKIYVKENNTGEEISTVFERYSARNCIEPEKEEVPLENIYYKIDDLNIYYTNEQKAGYTLLQNNMVPRLINSEKTVIIELYNDRFILPEDCDYLFSTAQNTSYNDTDKGITSNIKTMNYMFERNVNLTSLDFIEDGDVSNVTEMSWLFYGCNSITSLNLQNGTTGNATDLGSMFKAMPNVETIDISSFYTLNVESMYNMFSTNSNLRTIYASELFVTTNVLNYDGMFLRCTSIVGGRGTTYNSSRIDGVYARIDAYNQPGYFTYKSPKYEGLQVDLVENLC